MRFDQLTIKAQEAVQEAQSDARARGNAELSTDHLLLALLRQDEGVVVPILQKLGVDPATLAREVETRLNARMRGRLEIGSIEWPLRSLPSLLVGGDVPLTLHDVAVYDAPPPGAERGEKVIDPGGDKIGELEAVYVDTATDEPAFVTVRVGFIGRHRLAFVPLDGATVSPSAVRVRYAKKLVGEAPTIETDGELAAADEPLRLDE